MQDLCGERQGYPHRALRPLAVHALPHLLAGGLRGTSKRSPTKSKDFSLNLFLDFSCRAAPFAAPRSRAPNRSLWTPSIRASSTTGMSPMGDSSSSWTTTTLRYSFVYSLTIISLIRLLRCRLCCYLFIYIYIYILLL